MDKGQSQSTRTGGGREIALLVGVLMLVAAGTIATYWVRTRGVEATAEASSPAAPTPATPSRPRVAGPAPSHGEVVHADIYFDLKSTRLRAEAARLLQETAAAMERPETWTVLLQGYADRQGAAGFNRQLAERRATTVKQFLVELGVPDTSIRVVTIGPEGTLCDEPTAECAQLNRRVHLEIRRLTRTSAEPLRPALVVGDTLDTTAGRGERQ
jgi:peptidoglycan-associated lipoprotein